MNAEVKVKPFLPRLVILDCIDWYVLAPWFPHSSVTPVYSGYGRSDCSTVVFVGKLG